MDYNHPINNHCYKKISKSSSSSPNHEKKEETVDLLEDGWFFDNLLNRKPRISRCNSDPCQSKTKKVHETMNNNSNNNSEEKTRGSLHRAPSLPMYFRREKEEEDELVSDEEEEATRMGDLIRQAMPMPSINNNNNHRRLIRTPSLPPCRLVVKPREEDHQSRQVVNGQSKDARGVVGKLTRRGSIDSSSVASAATSKLTRRASIDSSTVLPPTRRSSSSKGMKQGSSGGSSSIPKAKPQKRLPDHNIPISSDPKPRNLDRSKSLMSISELEFEELQGFKDLGFSFDNKEDISPSVASIIPGLKNMKTNNNNDYNKDSWSNDASTGGNENATRRPYLSEAWESIQFSNALLPPPPPPPAVVPKWVDKNGISTEDMKAQIKFWARAVASNVRQEC